MCKNLLFVVILLSALILGSCNPTCDPISGLRVANFSPAGYEIAITATPLSQLEGKDIYFGNVKAENVKMEQDFLRVKVPASLKVGQTSLRIEDPDCQDVVQLDFTIARADTFNSNINFAFPVLPEIILPTLPNSFPSSIDKAWLGPVNPDYCLWFAMDSIVRNGKKVPKTTIDNTQSFEQSTCGDATKIYHLNPVYGVYDTTTTPRIIHIWIDRRSKPNGFIEEYTGTFQDMQATPYNISKFPATKCADLNPSGRMIVLTSLKTGKQLVVAQLKP